MHGGGAWPVATEGRQHRRRNVMRRLESRVLVTVPLDLEQLVTEEVFGGANDAFDNVHALLDLHTTFAGLQESVI